MSDSDYQPTAAELALAASEWESPGRGRPRADGAAHLDFVAFCLSMAFHGGMVKWQEMRKCLSVVMGGGAEKGFAKWSFYDDLINSLTQFCQGVLTSAECTCPGLGPHVIGRATYRQLEVKLDTRFSARRQAFSATSVMLCNTCNKVLSYWSQSLNDPDWSRPCTGLLELRCTRMATERLLRRRILPYEVFHDACTAVIRGWSVAMERVM